MVSVPGVPHASTARASRPRRKCVADGQTTALPETTAVFRNQLGVKRGDSGSVFLRKVLEFYSSALPPDIRDVVGCPAVP
jgi:hypothetical protein